MDQDTARTLFEQGGCLVILDAPEGIEFGIDLDSWETGPLFKGIKMIPPGIHYIHYSVVNSENQAGMRCGFFHSFASGEVLVRKWSTDEEQLMPADAVSNEDTERIKVNIRQLDSGLGAYPLTNEPESPYRKWLQLTAHITGDMLGRVLPRDGAFTSATGSGYEDEEMESARRMLERAKKSGAFDALARDRKDADGSADVDAQTIVDREIENATKVALSEDRFQFPHIDIRHSFPCDAPPSMIFQYSQDKSWLLRTSLAKHWSSDPGRLLGEFQLSFLIIFVGQNFTGFEHWKRLLQLVLSSAQVLGDRQMVSGLVIPLLRLLVRQLKECPHEFVTSVLEQDNFVARILCAFVLNVFESDASTSREELTGEIDKLRVFLNSAFGWKLPSGKQLQDEADREEGEYAPQVVEL
ncbi:AAR2-domain-containing protein [Martensiomyces pterosporus]|nr:AAR2-domain-containing protein [Martensiomyces pterosporus]